MTKHETREFAFLLLYETMLRGETSESLEALYQSTEELLERTVTPGVKRYVSGVLSCAEQLDSIIEQYSEKRALNRVAAINRTILRLALYELRTMPETPVNVVISEAVALSQAYAYAEDTAFINGVLGAYVRNNMQAAGEEADHGADSGTGHQ